MHDRRRPRAMCGLRKRQDKNWKFLDLALRVVVDRTERRESRCGGINRLGQCITASIRSALFPYSSDLLALPFVNCQRGGGVVLLQLWLGDAAAGDGVSHDVSMLAH